MNNKHNLIELGAITKPHGVKGEVMIKPFSDDPLALNQYGPLKDKNSAQKFTIETLRITPKGMLVAKIKEIPDRNKAETLKGTILCIERSNLPEIEEDEFYYSDLIGLEARLENGDLFGKIVNIVDFGAGDLIELMPQNSQNSMYLVFTKENVPAIHIAEGFITIIPPQEVELKPEQTEER